jgi:uncharacterized membrane protein YadS
VHDVAQVVATASTGGSAAIGAAIVVKLARIALLAPLVAGLGFARRRRHSEVDRGVVRRPPLLPLFVAGFLLTVAIRSTGVVPTTWLSHIKLVEQLLLASAMVGLGTGVRLSRLRRIGHKPLVLGMVSWALIATVAFVGTHIVR